jgi:hypothetical protein
MPILRTPIRKVSSHGSGSGPKRLRRGTAAGHGTTSRSSPHGGKRMSRSILAGISWLLYVSFLSCSAGVARTELFVRPHQAFSLSERTHLGPDMYVIARVSRVGSPQPQCMVYLDPHRALFVGRLQYATDVYLHRSTDSRFSMAVVT